MPETISQINIRESFKKNGIPAEDGPGINTLPVDPTILFLCQWSDLSDRSDGSDKHANHVWLFTAAFSPGPSIAAAPDFTEYRQSIPENLFPCHGLDFAVFFELLAV